jgi:hypothetical protein
MELYLEFGGGLGDIFYQMFHDAGYGTLQALAPQDRALIVLITHNPYARELFDHHPRASQLDVRDLGYWPPSDDAVMRRRHGLPQGARGFPIAGAPKFYPSRGDRQWLNRLDGTAYVVFSVSAGLPERDIPAELVERLVEVAIAHSLLPVIVGRNYSRFDRGEQHVQHRGVLNLIDRLTVPGVAEAVRRSLGVVCCHSAINMLAWLLRKPQLLLYPQFVYERHIAHRDQWAFGIDFEECRHGCFGSGDLLPTAERFFKDIQPRARGKMSILQSQDSAIEPTVSTLRFDDFEERLLAEAVPLAQNTRPGNIGFGWIYYGLVRNLNPDFVVSIGSCAGFAPFCAARALQDNGRGRLLFIDPSYSGEGHPGWGGRNYWSNPADVAARVASFGLTGWLEHLKMTSAEAFPIVRDRVGDGKVGLIIIDGAHTYADSLRDFELYSCLVREGYVLFHDATSPDCEVAKTLAELRTRGYALITLDIQVGLAMVEVRRSAAVRETWSYLCAESNRGELLLPLAQRVIRLGDRVLDIYCGFSPLTFLLRDVAVFGYDCDGEIVQELAARHPQHVWRQVADRQVQFAELPTEIDVILGLGVSRPYAPWDPPSVLDSVRYLLGRYFPRACLFETAADYHDGEILTDLAPALSRLGYRCEENIIHTNMASFPRRKILLGTR